MTDQAQRVQLPRGQWADLRPRLKVGQRNLIQRHSAGAATSIMKVETMRAEAQAALAGDQGAAITLMEGLNLSEADMGAVQQWQHASIVAWVAGWSESLGPLPTMDTVEDLDVDVYDALSAVCGPLTMGVMVDAAEDGPDGAGNPDSPSVPTDGSQPASVGSTSTGDPETSSSSSGSESSSTDSSSPVPTPSI